MGHDWVRRLSTPQPEPAVSSIGTQRRAASVIGEASMQWGITTGHRMASHILETLADWPGDRSEEEFEALHRATEASTLDTLTAMVTGDRSVMSQSTEPAQNISFYVSHGIPLNEVIRNVHKGQEFLTQALLNCIESFVPEAQRIQEIKDMTREVIECWSLFTTNMASLYALEHKRWSESREGYRMKVVDRILQGVRVSPTQVAKDLGHEMEQDHVAIAVWLEDVDADTARMFDFTALAREIAAVTMNGCPEPLVIKRGQLRADVWLGSPEADVVEALGNHGAWSKHIRISVGLPHHGITGFRASHREAESARHVVHLARSRDQVTAYRDIVLVSLLAADVDRSRDFVHTVLGALRTDDAWMSELRKTLAAHIDSNGSVTTTARALHTHRNTVNYRLRQIDELLGTRRNNTQIRCALYLAEYFSQEVLVKA